MFALGEAQFRVRTAGRFSMRTNPPVRHATARGADPTGLLSLPLRVLCDLYGKQLPVNMSGLCEDAANPITSRYWQGRS